MITDRPFIFFAPNEGVPILVNVLQIVQAEVGPDWIALRMSDGQTYNFQGTGAAQLTARLFEFSILPDGAPLDSTVLGATKAKGESSSALKTEAPQSEG